ncbi:MAG: Protein transport protein S9 plasma membrane t-SNARE [Trichoglossum hirsutum]|nr:MAG: Protein transport protein S9 plasma membrane t-SNARE [Trichoglossum hirsutum]
MKKFGFGKKSDKSDAGNDPNKSNPYAQSQNYSSPDPYAQDSNKYAGMGKPYVDRGRSHGGEPNPTQGEYGGTQADRYGGGDNRYGGNSGGYGGGYGADRYGGEKPESGSRYGPGGYGGLGRNESYGSTTTDDNRDALFAGSKTRTQNTQLPPANAQPGGGYGRSDGYSARSDGYDGETGGYGAYQDRQLTAEEEEEEDITATKQEIRQMKRDDVSSTQRALALAAQAEETGRSTLASLASQGERIHNTEMNLDLASNQNRTAEAKTKELKTLNKSMFAVHVGNPLTSGQRRRARDDDIRNQHRSEREQREATRQAASDSRNRVDGAFKELQPGDPGYKPKNKSSLAERAKYQFEADSEDEAMEDEIDSNLDALGGAAGRLNALAKATGKEVDQQNAHIERIIKKSDHVDDQITMNRARLGRIH